MTTDTSERGLERLICTALTGSACDPGTAKVRLRPRAPEPNLWRAGWMCGAARGLRPRVLRRPHPAHGVPARDAARRGRRARPRPGRAHAPQVPGAACRARSPSAAPSTCCATGSSTGPHHLDLFYGTPSPGNAKAAERFAQNRFSVTRQLALQPRREATGSRPGPVHQRPARRHLRAQEQPDQANGGRRRLSSTSATATRARSSSSSAAAWPTSPWTTTR